MPRSFVALLGLAACLACHAAPVTDALQRPALAVREPGRAVLLAAAQAGERIVAVGERGVIALSDDRGAHWRQAPSPVSVTLTTVRFADAKNGVAVGHGGTVLSSTDGGARWTLRLDGRRAAELAAAAASTPDEQREAARLVTDGPDKPFLDVLVWDARRWLVVGAYGLALRTDDGGATWTPWMARLPNPKALHWYVARRAGETLLLAGEQGLLARSDDGGASFRLLASPYKGSWFAAELPADGEIVVAGLRGNVWRSTDAGAHWTQLASPVPVSITASAQRADGALVFVNQAGMVLGLKDGLLRPLPGGPLPPLNGVLALPDGALLALSVHGARRLDAGGPAPQGPAR